jgi:hypothetical protein
LKTHVLSQAEHLDASPQRRTTDRGTDNVLSRALGNYWKDLLEIPTENNSNSTERALIVEEIAQSAFQCLYGMAMLHADFVPNDESCPSKEVRSLTVFRDVAEGFGIEAVNGDFEYGM